jgi:hypothetical protein
MAEDQEEQRRKFQQALSRATTTQTTEVESQIMAEANKVLMELGSEIGKETAGTKSAKHLGSAAVHIYELPLTQTRLFITQAHSTLNGVTETLASIACDELQLEAMARFGRGPRAKKGKK